MAWMRSNYNKYNNQKTVVDGITFDSKREARRYSELLLLEKAGAIQNLQRQVRFELAEAVRETDTVGRRGGKIKGKQILPGVYYIADFVYMENGQMVVEDVKSEATKTAVYEVKKKWMYQKYKIMIREVQ